jgi:hypothetical protein
MVSRLEMARWCCVGLFILANITLAGCGRNNEENNANAEIPQEAPALLDDGGASRLVLAMPQGYGPGLALAAADLGDTVSAIAGVGMGPGVEIVTSPPRDGSLVVSIKILDESDDALGDQGFKIGKATFGQSVGLEVSANTEVGAMYGLYDLVGELGTRYHHPEETHLPSSNPEATLPWGYDGSAEVPSFELRGFHEHTQHPTPMSDFYLRPEAEFRPYVSRYLQWMARNRQNAASWHMLKTVELETWGPYIEDVIDEAHGLGIKVGMVTSFVDEQQNNFKIITPDRVDSGGEVLSDDAQIEQVLTELHGLGFDFFTFQIGSSEFTKPSDQRVLDWLEKSAEVARGLEPKPELFTWIHTTCSLEADDGSYFYHLPGQSDPDIGTWVHTVMFHTLEHPAPVYDCENFHQQRDFMNDQLGKRRQVYFPETAWWLGFDNNMPLALPLTGYTRAWDIQQELAGKDVMGHITFTTGREWSYWQYDHYLMQATWDNAVGWEGYLDWISPLFGENGEVVTDTLAKWTERQKKDILEDNPLIYFYLAGELKQDEIGAKAGILARRPKIPYQDVAAYSDQEFDEWKSRDYDMLIEMRDAYAELLTSFERPDVPGEDASLAHILTYEVWAGLYLHVKRLEQAIALYSGVIEARVWIKLYASGTEYDDARRLEQRGKAEESLARARAVTEEIKGIIAQVEQHYRYPDEILIEPKEETLTAYPFGYLKQTHTAHFWVRRDDQLESFIEDSFSEDRDVWANEPALLFSARGNNIKMVEPDDAVASRVIASFIPQMLFGLDGDLDAGATASLVVGQDYNENFKPDEGTEVSFELAVDELSATASGESYTFVVRNNMGEVIGNGLELIDPEFELVLERDPTGLATLKQSDLEGQVRSQDLLDLVQEVGGIDEEGTSGLLKAVFDVPAEEELPEFLSIRFRLTFSAAP